MADRLSRRQLLIGGLSIAGAAVAAPVLARTVFGGSTKEAGKAAGINAHDFIGVPVSADDLPWAAARQIVAETTIPTFPNVTFDVTEYGAMGDGKTDNTAAIKKAVDAANAAGGGHVVVPPGTFVTGAVYLKSNVNLRVDGTLKFSGDAGKYPIVLTRYEGIECMNRSPMIYAYNETNIGLTGSGTLDAGGTSSWNKGSDRVYLESLIKSGKTDPKDRVVPGSGHNMRSSFVEPYACRNVLIQGVTLKNPMFWQIHPTLCTNVTVDSVHTDPSTAHPNTDGCDPESSDHVVIKNCVLGAHDDNIAIKSGRDVDGRWVNVPSQNVVIFGNTMNGNWGAVACGSEMTGGVKNVYAYKNNIVGETKFALYMKSNTQRGGRAQNINLDSITGAPTGSYVYLTSTYDSQTGNYPPVFGPITITNSSCAKAPQVFDMSGLSYEPVTGLTVTNCTFNNVSNASNTIKYVDNVEFTNVKINGKTITG